MPRGRQGGRECESEEMEGGREGEKRRGNEAPDTEL